MYVNVRFNREEFPLKALTCKAKLDDHCKYCQNPMIDVCWIVCRRVFCLADGVDGHRGLLFPSPHAVGGSAEMT